MNGSIYATKEVAALQGDGFGFNSTSSWNNVWYYGSLFSVHIISFFNSSKFLLLLKICNKFIVPPKSLCITIYGTVEVTTLQVDGFG